MKPSLLLLILLCGPNLLHAQSNTPYILLPDRVFDGDQMHEGWGVVVAGDQIAHVGPVATLPSYFVAETIPMFGLTLMPGMIEGHSHLLLHPYDETPWNDQVLKESQAERVARGTVHAKKTLWAGFTTVRDLGAEGAGYADVGLKQAIEKGVIPGPRMLVAGPAIVATGSYGPKGFHADVDVPLGAEVADGHDGLLKVVRDQIGKGADLIKVYADYRWGPNGEARPTFSEEELSLIVKTAASSGRPVVAHAATAEGMRRAVLAGVETLEHGDGGTTDVFALMAERNVALCPTLGAVEAISEYQGWNKQSDILPLRVAQKREMMKIALAQGVSICVGSDVGVFDHGENAWELALMVAYGMTPLDVLRAATSGNAALFHLEDKVGRIKPGLWADLVAVEGNPLQDINSTRQVQFVMKGGIVYRNETRKE